jgi:hypothetical protein
VDAAWAEPDTARKVRGRRAARARMRVLYATGFFGGFGFLGFGLLFGVLSPTRHLLPVAIGRPTVWLLAWTACGLRLWLAQSARARPRDKDPDAPVRSRDVELQRQRLAGTVRSAGSSPL